MTAKKAATVEAPETVPAEPKVEILEVTVAEAFNAVPPGEVYPKTIKAGEVVSGRLAEIAIDLGKAEVEAE